MLLSCPKAYLGVLPVMFTHIECFYDHSMMCSCGYLRHAYKMVAMGNRVLRFPAPGQVSRGVKNKAPKYSTLDIRRYYKVVRCTYPHIGAALAACGVDAMGI